jgi:hypothetical protein
VKEIEQCTTETMTVPEHRHDSELPPLPAISAFNDSIPLMPAAKNTICETCELAEHQFYHVHADRMRKSAHTVLIAFVSLD